MPSPKEQRPARKLRTKEPAPPPSEENFRTRNAKLKREKMLGRLLAATMEVCADTQRRGAAVIDDVVRAAGVSRGAFYWYFDSLDEAIETLGRRLADDISAETYELFRGASAPADPVLGAAIGGQVMLSRAVMDRVWSNYMSNIHVLLDDSRFVRAVRHNLELGREQGRFQFESLTQALDFQIGAVMGAIRRCAGDKPPPLSEMVEVNVLILRGLGLDVVTAREVARQAERIVNEVGPSKLPWWQKKPPRSAKS
jgi:AcrR family transcriptional regulator